MVETIVVAILLIAAVVIIVVRRQLDRVTVYEFQRGLRYKDGRLVGVVEPGRYWILGPSTIIQHVDVRERVVSIPGQEIVTADGFSIKVSLTIRQKVVDPIVALTAVDDHQAAIYAVIQVALREAIGAVNIDELLQRRTEISDDVFRRSVGQVRAVGVELVSVKVKDLMFPGPLKRTFAQVVEARQQGLAALEKARGETAALRNLANAGRMVESHPSLLQLRLLQQLEASKGNTIVLGFPATSTPIPVRSEPAGPTPELPTGPFAEDLADTD